VKPIKDLTVGELAAFICSHLQGHGIDVVLSGGSCVSIFSENRYVSSDLDFIEYHTTKRKKIRAVMAKIGFSEENRYFKHEEVSLIVEFPAGPPAVGNEPVQEIIELKFATGVLRLLSPTDCVKDRLAGYYHWGDQQCLVQAILVAQATEVDLREVARWSRHEGKETEFIRFRQNLEKGNPG